MMRKLSHQKPLDLLSRQVLHQRLQPMHMVGQVHRHDLLSTAIYQRGVLNLVKSLFSRYC